MTLIKRVFDSLYIREEKYVGMWKKTHPITFIHSGDLMSRCTPSKKKYENSFEDVLGGVTPAQIGVIRNYINICNISNHGYKYNDYVDSNEIDRYKKFINYLDKAGYNPEINPIPVKIQPYFGIGQGTHRIAYFLYKNPNCFIPVRIQPPINSHWLDNDGIGYVLDNCNSSEAQEKLNMYAKCYQDLQKKIRTSVVGIIRKEIIDTFEKEIVSMFSKYGKILIKKNDTKIYYKDKFRKLFKRECELEEIYYPVELTLLYNDLLYTKGKVLSKQIAGLTSVLEKNFHTNFGLVANTITESVLLEEVVHGYSANVKDRNIITEG